MSNNHDELEHSPSVEDHKHPKLPPFIAIEYDGRKAVIQRNPSYQVGPSPVLPKLTIELFLCLSQETIGSIKKLYTTLWGIPDDEIRLCARLDEMDDIFLIAEELWSELLPGLKHIKVTLDRSPPGGMIVDRPSPKNTILDQTSPKSMIPDSLLNKKIQSERTTFHTCAIGN